jgi:hypothetical protein
MSDRRVRVQRDERVVINREFESVEEFIREYVTNLSRSGAFIRSKTPLPVGTRCNLKFTVIMEELETIQGIGEVVRVSSSPSGMGVVFIELSEHSQDLIAKLLTRRQPSSPAMPAATKTAPSRTSDIVPSPVRVPASPAIRGASPVKQTGPNAAALRNAPQLARETLRQSSSSGEDKSPPPNQAPAGRRSPTRGDNKK